MAILNAITGTRRYRHRRRVAAYVVMVIIGLVIVMMLRGREDRTYIVAMTNEPCATITLRSMPAKDVLAARLTRRSPGGVGASDRVVAFAIEYLHASMSGCADAMINLRDGDAWHEELMSMARQGAAVHGDRAPATGESEARALALWWFRTAEPWAWVDLRSVSLAPIREDSGRAMGREWVASWSAKAAGAPKGRPPTPYMSMFTPDDAEFFLQTGELFVLRATFGLRAEAAGDDVLHARVLLYELPDGRAGVIAVLLDGNLLPLWSQLVL